VVDVGGAIDHGDHRDHGLQPVGGLHLAAKGKLGALFHEEKKGVVVFFLAVHFCSLFLLFSKSRLVEFLCVAALCILYEYIQKSVLYF
jgi:hypothetical protein